MFRNEELNGTFILHSVLFTSFNLYNLVQHLNTNILESEHTYLPCLGKASNKLQKKFQ